MMIKIKMKINVFLEKTKIIYILIDGMELEIKNLEIKKLNFIIKKIKRK